MAFVYSQGPQDYTKVDPGLVGSKVPDYLRPVLTDDESSQLENLSTSYDYYKLFQPDIFVNDVVYQSRLYGVQKSFRNLSFVTKDTYRCTEAVLLHSGYHHVPARNMLWQKRNDCHNSLVSDNIRRDDVDAMLRCLHFRDNLQLDDDPFYKVSHIYFFLH